MKKILALLIALFLLPQEAYAALNAATLWELRTSGNDTNGGGFAYGITAKSTKTDLVIDATVPSKISSAGYVFTSADIGRFVKVTAGTGFTVGIYGPITAVSVGVATVDRAVGTVGSTAGSFSIYWGLDYTQQNAANSNGGSNGSSVIGVTAGTTTITCADCLFTNDIVGSVIYVSGGTGSITAGRYAVVTYTNATTIVVDRSTGLTAGTGVTLNIGGALATFAETFGARGIVSGNRVWWKNDSAMSSSTAISSPSISFDLFGYNSTRGDITGTLGTSRPSFTFTGTGAIAMSINGTGNVNLQNFSIDANSGAGNGAISQTAGSAVYLYNVTGKNYDTVGINLNGGAAAYCLACEATGGTSNATIGINTTSGRLISSYVHDGHGIGINGANNGGGAFLDNIIYNMTGATSDCIKLGVGPGVSVLMGNIGVSCGGNGINLSSTPLIMMNNILESNGGYGITSLAAIVASPLYDGNAFYNNTSGATNNISDTSASARANPAYQYVNNINLSGDAFNNPSGHDFGLNNTSGAGAAIRNNGLPRAWTGLASTTGYPDMGAVTHPSTACPVVPSSCAF